MKRKGKLKKYLISILSLIIAFTVSTSDFAMAMDMNNVDTITNSNEEFNDNRKKPTTIIDLDGKTVSNYSEYTNVAEDATRYAENNDGNGIIPIENWKRSSNPLQLDNAVRKPGGNRNEYVYQPNWTWNDVRNIQLNITDENAVWDGSRLQNGNVNHTAQKIECENEGTCYIKENQISAKNQKIYDSATWDDFGDGNGHATMYRFQGEFTIPDSYDPNLYSYTIKQVTDQVGIEQNKLFINDNIYVFIYPKDEYINSINNENYLDHLAFWTGTSNNHGITSFHNHTNTKATKDQNPSSFGVLTDGWHTEPVEDNAANAILRYYNSKGCKDFVVDVFVEDYNTAGGMYRLELEQKVATRYPVELYKFDSDKNALAGATFTLVENTNQRTYSAESDENGKVSFSVFPGSYTLTETNPPAGYKPATKTWSISVRSDGSVEYDRDLEYDKGIYYVTNEKDINGQFTIKKITSREDPLSNAQFTLYDKDGSNVINGPVTSDNQGNVSFVNIPVGEYVLKETKAPEGYVVSKEVWKVNVDNEGITTIKDSKGNPLVDKKIINYTEEEIIAESLYRNKTAKVENYENRVYEIDLNAYTTGSTTTESMQDIDVMFILDKSTSMEEGKRESDLENAVRNFLTQMYNYKKSGKLQNSRFAILEFSGSCLDRTNGWKSTEEEFEYWKNNYELQIPNWGDGTEMNSALNKAYNNYYYGSDGWFGSHTPPSYPYNKENKQIIITLTDGEDNRENSAINTANKIREKVNGITFYGIGLGDKNEHVEDFLKQIVNNDENLSFIEDGGDSTEKLNKVFQDILNSSTQTDLYKDAKIIDYIDSRFQVCVKDGDTYKVFTDEEVKDKGSIKLDNGGLLKYDEKRECQYIEWTQDIGADETKDEFNEKFYIKAKEDFIGGNMIPTNGDESGVTVNSENKNVTVNFPKPTVNVKLLNINGNEKTTKFFIEDMINPSNLITDLNGTFSIIKLDGNKLSLPTLTYEEMAKLLRGEAVTKEYSYANTNDNVGYFTYYLKEKISLEEHEAIKVGANVEEYHLNVKYTSYTEEDRKQKFDDSYSKAVGDTVSFKDTQSKNIVDVVAGSINITKEITDNSKWNEVLEGAPIFSFKIDRYVNGTVTPVETYYRTISFKDEKNKTLEAEILDNLPRGKYVVTELGTQRYTNVKVEDNHGINTGIVDDKTITFNIGVDVNKDNYSSLNGKAKFTNDKTGDSGKRTDTDVILNRFTKDENGNWTVQQITKPQNPANSIIQRGKGLVNSFISLFEF